MEKSLTLRIYETLLRLMARSVLWRQRPFIIGITGSVGKTTTKDMIAHILRDHRTIWYTKKNYNNEVGVPLTVLGIDRNVDSLRGMAYTIYRWFCGLCTTHYPEIVIVEMGVDHPGDMEYLMHIVSPDISIMTTIAPAHSEFFPRITDIAKEKQKIVTMMKRGGVAIINADDLHVSSVCDKTKNRCVTYGIETHADFMATDVDVCFQQCFTTGLSFKINYDGKMIPVRLRNLCADHMVYAALAALAVAHELKINVLDAVTDLADFVSSPGRMRLLPAKNDALVIDDTYNASPKAMKSALCTLGKIPAKRKIAVLGDMLELGSMCMSAHQDIARLVIEHKIDHAIFVGVHVQHAYDELQKRGWHDDRVQIVTSPDDAGAQLTDIIVQGDVVLVKGSQGMRMEKVVERILRDGEDVRSVLCRQNDAWRTRAFVLHGEKCVK